MDSLTFAGRYKIIKRIGKGSYSQVYSGIDLISDEPVAIKLEDLKGENYTVPHENTVYETMKNEEGFPKIYHSGQEHGYNVLVMELLGLTLKKLFNNNKRKFSLKTVLMLGDQLLFRLEQLHRKLYVHRDIKLANIMMGRDDKRDLVYLIDIGLAKKYGNGKYHIPYKKNQRQVGNSAFASRRAHLKHEISRRDDLESLGYVLIYLLRGNLPWRGIPASNSFERLRQMEEHKLATTIDSLCEGCPRVFVKYFNYCQNLKFAQEPDYNYLRQLLRSLGHKMNLTYDNIYDWTKTQN